MAHHAGHPFHTPIDRLEEIYDAFTNAAASLGGALDGSLPTLGCHEKADGGHTHADDQTERKPPGTSHDSFHPFVMAGTASVTLDIRVPVRAGASAGVAVAFPCRARGVSRQSSLVIP